MGRLAWSQLRSRPTRALALLAGMLVAAAAFTVLTAASRTAQVRTVGQVSANYVPAYDILVRPKGARTAVETRTGTVQPDFLSGIYGGITMAQYRQIQRIQGVQVAAPTAMAGYALMQAEMFVPLPASALKGSARQLYRISTTWVSDNGTSHVTQPSSYLYVTPLKITPPIEGQAVTDGTGPGCTLGSTQSPAANPFAVARQSYTLCWSRANQKDQPSTPGVASDNEAGYYVQWTIPVLIAAIDPQAEARLDGLNHAMISGGYLSETGGSSTYSPLPVLVSADSGMNEYAETTLQQLTASAKMPDMDAAWASAQASVPGHTVATVRTTAQQAYDSLLLGGPTDTYTISPPSGGTYTGDGDGIFGYWSVGPVQYQRDAAGTLTPRLQANPTSVWNTNGVIQAPVPVDNEDTQYRTLTGHPSLGAGLPLLHIDGTFSPGRIKQFDPLSEVPLGAYQPVVATPATAASRRALHGSALLPSQNLGGLVSQPVNLVTTLAALPKLENQQGFKEVPAADPISVIRVRVAGATKPDALSRARVDAVAQQIAQRTGLDVDVVVGSSPSPVTIDLPAGKYGQPSLTLTEGWVKKGAAVAILNAVDRKSLALFTLILVVCVLFVGNAATAAVRGRRRELGVLAAVGWRRRSLFASVLGELAGIGLVAGLLAAAVAVPASAALGLRASPGRALLAVPVAVAVAVAGGLVPAWRAARADPVSSVRPPVLAAGRGHQPRGIVTLAVLNVTRTPGRTLVGVASLAVGCGALTLLAAVTVAFRGQVIGTLLGNYIAVQVKSIDYIAAGATVALGVLAVADVVFLNITERAAELATLRSFGWRDGVLARLVVSEGALMGAVGSLLGAGLGLGAAAWFAGQLPVRLLLIALGVVAAGVVVTAAATLLPAVLLRRLPTAYLLAEE